MRPVHSALTGSGGWRRGNRPAATAAAVFGLVLTLIVTASRPGVAEELEIDRLARLLELGEGTDVADVGAGDGQWSELLAELVGPTGRLYATEVESEMVDDLHVRLAEAGIENATVILGGQRDTGLPSRCCDAILLRLVYHHFEEPDAMRASLRRALRPGGRLAVVDIRPQRHWRQLDKVPERNGDGHGIEPEDLIAELVASGFDLVALHEDWNDDDDRYCVLFKR